MATTPEVEIIENIGIVEIDDGSCVELQVSSSEVEVLLCPLVQVAANEITFDGSSAGMTSTNVYDAIIETYSATDGHFTHLQLTPAAVWNINHGLGKFPSIQVSDSSGRLVLGKVEHVDENNSTITFTSAFSGKAYFN